MQIFSCNVILFHLRCKILEVELQLINMLLWYVIVTKLFLEFILIVEIELTFLVLYLSQLLFNHYLQFLSLLLIEFL